jgi:hypothetical protein
MARDQTTHEPASTKRVNVKLDAHPFSSKSRQSGSLPFDDTRVGGLSRAGSALMIRSALRRMKRPGVLWYSTPVGPATGLSQPKIRAFAADLILVHARPHMPIANDSVYTQLDLEMEKPTDAANSCPQPAKPVLCILRYVNQPQSASHHPSEIRVQRSMSFQS